MARINVNEMSKENSTARVHQLVKCSFKVFNHNYKKYIQIDTYGTNQRQDIGKISQSIQFDRDSAIALIKLLKKEFEV